MPYHFSSHGNDVDIESLTLDTDKLDEMVELSLAQGVEVLDRVELDRGQLRQKYANRVRACVSDAFTRRRRCTGS